MKQNPWACLRAASAIHHSRCALAFASHEDVYKRQVLLVLCVTTDLRIQSFLTGCHSSPAKIPINGFAILSNASVFVALSEMCIRDSYSSMLDETVETRLPWRGSP